MVKQTIGKHDAGYNLSLALNYGHAAGSPHLVRFVTEQAALFDLIPHPKFSLQGCELVG